MTIRARFFFISAFFVFVVMSGSLHAEVMDKEPSIVQNWIVAVSTGIVALGAWRWRWWAGAFVSALFAVAVAGVWSELSDPFVGPAIREEAGSGYGLHFYASVAFGTALHCAAAVHGHRRRRARSAV